MDYELVNELKYLNRCIFLIKEKEGIGSKYETLQEVAESYRDLVVSRPVEVAEAERFIRLVKNKRHNLCKRVSLICDCVSPVFLTFTFNDSSLSSLNMTTRRKYVAQWLKAHFRIYVANLDFGSLNGRPHFHAVAAAPIDPVVYSDHLKWKCGYISVRAVKSPSTDKLRMSRYIYQMVNHAMKETASSIIYSRNIDLVPYYKWDQSELYEDPFSLPLPEGQLSLLERKS